MKFKEKSKNILFICKLYPPHIGGVEKHVFEISRILKEKGYKLTILTEKYDDYLESSEIVNGIRVIRICYPYVKFFGIFFIWWKLFGLRKLIKMADLIHIHDVFIWYLPFKLFYPSKRIIITSHGLEFDKPFSKTSIWQKRLANKLADKTIGVGKYLERFLNIKFDLITYGGITPSKKVYVKKKDTIVYLGRLDRDTGINNFLYWLNKNPKYKVEFCGDGPMRKLCEKFGKVHGFIKNTSVYLNKSEYCVPGGYLSALEALNVDCKLKLFWNTRLRGEIWKSSPFVRKNAASWAKKQTWEKLADEYIRLYNSI